tara:strand:- start:1608 stop:1991 length:384 start_codon:yes stop_codon:yes gene_type:complete
MTTTELFLQIVGADSGVMVGTLGPGVTQKRLNLLERSPAFKHVGCTTMAEKMRMKPLQADQPPTSHNHNHQRLRSQTSATVGRNPKSLFLGKRAEMGASVSDVAVEELAEPLAQRHEPLFATFAHHP